MVQTFMVVRCFKCETFQVELVKKSTKWKCKICAANQSVRQVYGKGMASDCRRHVQRLNMARGEEEQLQERAQLSSPPEQYEEDDPTIGEVVQSPHPVLLQAEGSSRWATFISSGHEGAEGEGEAEEDDGLESSSGYHFTTDVIEYQQEKKRRKKETPEKEGRWHEDRSAASVCDVLCKEDSGSEHSIATQSLRGRGGDAPVRWDSGVGEGHVGVLDGLAPYRGESPRIVAGERKFSCPVLPTSEANDQHLVGEAEREGSFGKIGWKSGSYKVTNT